MIPLASVQFTHGGTFEVWPLWAVEWPMHSPIRYIPTIHYRRDRVGD